MAGRSSRFLDITIQGKFQLLLASVAVIFFAVGVLSYRYIAPINPIWHTYQDDVVQRNKLLNQIQAGLGYGGAIHNFKNSDQQIRVADEINRNVVSISQVAEQNANGSQEAAQAAVELEQLAGELGSMVRQFRT